MRVQRTLFLPLLTLNRKNSGGLYPNLLRQTGWEEDVGCVRLSRNLRCPFESPVRRESMRR
jgi:hypothetical protein